MRGEKGWIARKINAMAELHAGLGCEGVWVASENIVFPGGSTGQKDDSCTVSIIRVITIRNSYRYRVRSSIRFRKTVLPDAYFDPAMRFGELLNPGFLCHFATW